MNKKLQAGYTVEAAGVMAAVLFTIMIIIRAAFSLQAEVRGIMGVHYQVEAERHAVASREEKQIEKAAQGKGWSITISAPVFRPEQSLRLWSIMEGNQ
ncbi:MAG: hypothetical protein ACRDBO_10980 [Lachnospiraceae bacterium]